MKYVDIDSKTWEVADKIEAGKAYIKGDIVYPVHNMEEGEAPGIYIKGGKAKIKKYRKGKEITVAEIYEELYDNEDEEEESSGGILDLFDEIEQNKDKIIKSAESPVLTKEEKGDIFAPPINDEDNILVRIVKSILKQEQINIKILQPRFKDAMEMNNAKRSLRIHTKMSIERFERWMEVLGYEWDVTYSVKKKK
jgi:hypothetical protein